MPPVNISRTTYRVADFLSWQQSNQLRLSPAFQRRPVWNPIQKSFLLDTVIRGLPVPIVFTRDSIDLETHRSYKEMVDGQQRIRTLLSFIDPDCLEDFDPDRDAFTIRSVHNREFAGRTFNRLPEDVRRDILSYEISTHILPLGFEDRDVLQVFARMNSTGLQLNDQELRNAEFAGEFKSWSYELATEQLDRWRYWGIFTETQISRMKEVETVSDLLINMEQGVTGKTQKRIYAYYQSREEEWPRAEVAAVRFRHTMDTIDRLLGPAMAKSAWSSEVNFFTLFAVIYDLEWGLGSKLASRKPLRRLQTSVGAELLQVGDRLASGDVPENVLDAVQRASADTGRRETRFKFVRNALTIR